MITLQKRAGHEIAALDATQPSHLIPCPPRTLLRHNNHSTITSAEGYASWRGWEKGSTPKKTIPTLAWSITHDNADDWRHQDHHLWRRSFNTAKGPQYNGCIYAITSSKHTLPATNQPSKLMNHPHQRHRAKYYLMLIPLKPLPTNYPKRLIMSSTYSENITTLSWKTTTIAPPNIIPLFTKHQRLATGQKLTQAIQGYLPTMCPKYILSTLLRQSHHFICTEKRTPAHPVKVLSSAGLSQTQPHPCCHPQVTHTVVTWAHLEMRTTPNNCYNPMNPYATTIDTQNKQLNIAQFIPKMPEDCGIDDETLMVTFLLMHHLTCPNSNTSLITCANRMLVPGWYRKHGKRETTSMLKVEDTSFSVTMLTEEQMAVTIFIRVLQSSSPHYSTKHGDWQGPPLHSPWIQKMTLLDG